MSDLLRPDNHAMFDHMRLMLIARDPVCTLEEIGEEFGGVPVPELIAWFLSYRLPTPPKVIAAPEGFRPPRDPELRAELNRLRRREESLVTVVTETPMQLAIVQGRIKSLERVR